jgi:hypothetical protein
VQILADEARARIRSNGQRKAAASADAASEKAALTEAADRASAAARVSAAQAAAAADRADKNAPSRVEVSLPALAALPSLAETLKQSSHC